LAQELEKGEKAPRFGLLAAGSGRRVDTRDVMGRLVVLIFHLQGMAPTAREINRAVRAHHPDPEDVLVASVIDLSIVPPFYWMSVGLILG
jgi:peroxiredoxin